MQTDYLNEILVSSSKNVSSLPDLLKSVLDNKDYAYKPPCIYVEWSEGSRPEDPMFDRCVLYSYNLNPLLKIIGEEASSVVLQILANFEEADRKRQITRGVLYEIIQSLEKEGFKVLTAIRPAEWNNAFFVFKNTEDVIAHYLLHHFEEGLCAEGWFDDFFIDYNKTLNQYLNDGYSHLFDPRYAAKGVDFSDRNQLKFILEENERYSKTVCRDNLEILNLDELFFETAKKGLFAAKKFC